MSFVDPEERELNVKIAYYGPGLTGKATNLQYIHQRTDPAVRTQMRSIASETERLLFFSFTPQTLGTIRGLRIRIHLYTVPGSVFYDLSRDLLLQGVDGVVFVADSQEARREANIESMANLANNLATRGISLELLPLTLQYNKRDLPEILSVEALDHDLNPRNLPRFEAIASRGEGVFDSLKNCSRQILSEVTKNQ